MKYYTLSPPSHLSDYVRFFWVYEHEATPAAPYVYRSLADGSPELIFHYQGRFSELTANQVMAQPFSLIHGQSHRYRRFVVYENFGIFGAYLYPYAIPLLTGLPTTALTYETPDLEMLFGKEGKVLEERMMLARDNVVRMKIIAEFLERKLISAERVSKVPQASIRYMMDHQGTIPVKRLAATFNLSIRQMERKVKEYTGFSPKLFSRILRFHAALREYGNKDLSLTEIAYACGYYDQSHFIQEFKEFSGYHPKTYFKGKAEGIEFREV